MKKFLHKFLLLTFISAIIVLGYGVVSVQNVAQASHDTPFEIFVGQSNSFSACIHLTFAGTCKQGTIESGGPAGIVFNNRYIGSSSCSNGGSVSEYISDQYDATAVTGITEPTLYNLTMAAWEDSGGECEMLYGTVTAMVYPAEPAPCNYTGVVGGAPIAFNVNISGSPANISGNTGASFGGYVNFSTNWQYGDQYLTNVSGYVHARSQNNSIYNLPDTSQGGINYVTADSLIYAGTGVSQGTTQVDGFVDLVYYFERENPQNGEVFTSNISVSCQTLVNVTVNPATGFTCTASPNPVSINPGDSTAFTITTSPSAGFSSPVTFTSSINPNTGTPPSVSIDAATNGRTPPATTTANVSSTASTTAGTYSITFTGTGGGETAQCSVQLTVNPAAANFNLVIQPGTSTTGNPNATIVGNNYNFTVFAECTGGFAGPISNLVASTAFAGAVITFTNSGYPPPDNNRLAQLNCGATAPLVVNTSSIGSEQQSTPQNFLLRDITVTGEGQL